MPGVSLLRFDIWLAGEHILIQSWWWLDHASIAKCRHQMQSQGFDEWLSKLCNSQDTQKAHSCLVDHVSQVRETPCCSRKLYQSQQCNCTIQQCLENPLRILCHTCSLQCDTLHWHSISSLTSATPTSHAATLTKIAQQTYQKHTACSGLQCCISQSEHCTCIHSPQATKRFDLTGAQWKAVIAATPWYQNKTSKTEVAKAVGNYIW